MQQVKRTEFSHLRHPRRERQIVRRKLEQRITRDRDFVIDTFAIPPVQPKRLRIRNEVNLVSRRGKLNAQLRCQLRPTRRKWDNR